MDLDKIKINPVAIKNYLYDNHLVDYFEVSRPMVKVNKKQLVNNKEVEITEEVQEVHWLINLTDGNVLDVRRDVKLGNQLYVNDIAINDWENFLKLLM